MRTLIFDIETRGNKNAHKFQPDKWKTGNVKDPDKLSKAIEEKKQAWEAGHALSPLTGEVCMFGYISTHDLENNPVQVIVGDERDILEAFWDLYASHDQYITSGGADFDFPFIKVRSWINGIKPLTQAFRDKRIPNHLDIAELWTSGMYGEFVSLKNMATALGFDIGSKGSDISERFGYYLETDPELAKLHCSNDVNLTLKISQIILKQ